MERRTFLTALGLAPFAAQLPGATTVHAPKGKAEHCIFIWLGGGMGQIDTFDPKSLGDNQASKKKAGSLYPSIETSVAGVRVCEHLPRTAKLMEHVTAVRSVHHKVIDEHAFATNLVHTGRMVSGNAIYPSLGSIVAHRRGALDPKVPAYMLIGFPNVSRGPGFLGVKDGYVYLVDTQTGPAGFARPDGLTADREADRRVLLAATGEAAADSALAEYAEAQREAFRLAGPSFMKHFDLTKEPADLRASYGGEFGQRCLLARRLVEGGVRIAALRLDARGAWEIDLDNGVRVRLGRRQVDERFERFVAAALRLVVQRPAEMSYVDMRYTNGFAVGWRNGTRVATADELDETTEG